MRILGIDPGLKGALAIVIGGQLQAVWDMPVERVALAKGLIKTRIDSRALAGLVQGLGAEAAFLEQVSSHSGEGPMGAFAFGRTVGNVEGVLGAIGLRATQVPPQSWHRAVGVRRPPEGGSIKDASRVKAAQLWLDKAHLFKRKKDDGRADAALLAWYGHLTLSSL